MLFRTQFVLYKLEVSGNEEGGDSGGPNQVTGILVVLYLDVEQ